MKNGFTNCVTLVKYKKILTYLLTVTSQKENVNVAIYSQLSLAIKRKRLFTVNCHLPFNMKVAIYSQLSLAKNVKMAIYSRLSLAIKRKSGYLQSSVTGHKM